MITLYQFATSPLCEKVRRILHYKGLDFEIHDVPRNEGAKYERVSPTGKFPAIDDDGTPVWDSTDIAHHIEAKHPTPALIPSDPREAAMVHVIEDWADESLYFYEITMRVAWEHNAVKVAEFLNNDSRVSWVKYAGDPNNPYYSLTQKYLPKGGGAVMTFGIKGGQAAGQKFIEGVNFLSHLANIGDARTLVIHPASTTHRQLNEEEQLKAGISPDMIRISVGLETIDDILWDIDQALG